MNTSSSLVSHILTWAYTVLDEVKIAMSNSYVTEPETEDDVREAQELIERLLTSSKTDIDEIASNIEYEDLVMKLQAQNMPIDPDEWDNSNLD